MRIHRRVSFAFMCAVGVAACNGGNPASPSSAGDSGTGTMSATIDGAAFSASGAGKVVATRAGGANFSITGANTTGAQLAIIMAGVTLPGTYDIGAGGVGAATYSNASSTWLSATTGGTGTITFTTLTTTHATGTFSFVASPVVGTTATGPKFVTAGSFDVSLGPS